MPSRAAIDRKAREMCDADAEIDPEYYPTWGELGLAGKNCWRSRAKTALASKPINPEDGRITPAASTTIRVCWTGRATGHARWLTKIVTVASEDEARALVAAPMKAGFNQVYAQRENPAGGRMNRWKTFASRKR